METPEFSANAAQKILPPFWFFGGLGGMALTHFVYPTPVAVLSDIKLLGWVIFCGAFIMAWRAKRRFDLAETPVKPFSESTVVVESGLFRLSRNPMYLAMNIGLTGFAIAIGDGLPFLIAPAFFMVITTQFIQHEERLMEARFGQAYLEYKARVRRWI